MPKRLVYYILLTIIITLLSACNNQQQKKKPNYPDNVPKMLSLSSDGHYAVTSHINQQLVLWNLQNRTHKTINTNANIYSAYFIKHTDYFMWQDTDSNEVYIEDVNGNLIKQFNPGFASYGEVITPDLQYYIAVDKRWNLVWIHGDKKIDIMRHYDGSDSYYGIGKLIDLSLHDNKLLTVGCPLVAVWNVKNGHLVYKFNKNLFKTVANFSPDGKYIVTGDENGISHLLSAKNGQLIFRNASPLNGLYVQYGPDADYSYYDKSKLIEPPSDYKDYLGTERYQIINISFVDKNHYLRFIYYLPYAALYSTTSPWPIKYIRLAPGKIPNINITNLQRAASATKTIPAKHLLVMGQATSNGFIVYKYDPKTMSLHQLWQTTL